MLPVDIAGSIDQELQRVIGESCAPHGDVVKVRLHVSRVYSASRPCAIVEMATAEQATHAADFLEATSIGNSVVILLDTKPLSAKYSATPRAKPDTRPKTMYQLLVQYESLIRSKLKSN